MKKRGFTIPEVLIAMTIIGVIAVIVFAVVQRITPDSDKAMIKKAYYTAEEVTADLLNNNWVYPDCEACSTKAQCNGKTYYGLDDDRSATHQGVIYLSGATKYPQLFAAKLNAKYNITTNSFATPDGIIYDFSNIVSTPWVHGATIESSGNPYITVTLPSNISFKVHVLVNGKMYINKDDKAAVEAVTAHNIFNKTTPVTSDPAAYTRSYSDNDCKGCPENETKVQGYCIPNDKICAGGTTAKICGQCINPATVQQCSGKDSTGNFRPGIILSDGKCWDITNDPTCTKFPDGWNPGGPDTPPGLPNVTTSGSCTLRCYGNPMGGGGDDCHMCTSDYQTCRPVDVECDEMHSDPGNNVDDRVSYVNCRPVNPSDWNTCGPVSPPPPPPPPPPLCPGGRPNFLVDFADMANHSGQYTGHPYYIWQTMRDSANGAPANYFINFLISISAATSSYTFGDRENDDRNQAVTSSYGTFYVNEDHDTESYVNSGLHPKENGDTNAQVQDARLRELDSAALGYKTAGKTIDVRTEIADFLWLNYESSGKQGNYAGGGRNAINAGVIPAFTTVIQHLQDAYAYKYPSSTAGVKYFNWRNNPACGPFPDPPVPVVSGGGYTPPGGGGGCGIWGGCLDEPGVQYQY